MAVYKRVVCPFISPKSIFGLPRASNQTHARRPIHETWPLTIFRYVRRSRPSPSRRVRSDHRLRRQTRHEGRRIRHQACGHQRRAWHHQGNHDGLLTKQNQEPTRLRQNQDRYENRVSQNSSTTEKGYDKTKSGTETAYDKTVQGTKTGYHKTVNGTKTGYHKTVDGTKTGATKWATRLPISTSLLPMASAITTVPGSSRREWCYPLRLLSTAISSTRMVLHACSGVTSSAAFPWIASRILM